MNSTPLVSIVIPVYNGVNYLAEAIDSAIDQTYKNIEVLVINDGSNDSGATRNLALSYGDKIRYFEKENGGVATALNLGIKEMRGEYFSWLSHDDVYLPDKIEAQINYLQAIDEKTAILYSDFCYIDEASEFKGDYHVPRITPSAFRLYFIMGGIIHGCTLLIPSICFKECGTFNTQLKTTQDYELWFRFSEKFNFIHIPQVLVKSRTHAQQDTVKLRSVAVIEGNKLCLHFIKSIKRSEIISGYFAPISLYYFAFAKNMMHQGYRIPMKYAFFAGLRNVLTIKKYKRKFLADAFVLSKAIIKNNP